MGIDVLNNTHMLVLWLFCYSCEFISGLVEWKGRHLKYRDPHWTCGFNPYTHLLPSCFTLASVPVIYSRRMHDDVIKWKHFPRNWPFVRGIHQSPVNSPHEGQWRGALMFSLICVWINDWVNNREAGDLRSYRAHYAVIVMVTKINLHRTTKRSRARHEAYSVVTIFSDCHFCVYTIPFEVSNMNISHTYIVKL